MLETAQLLCPQHVEEFFFSSLPLLYYWKVFIMMAGSWAPHWGKGKAPLHLALPSAFYWHWKGEVGTGKSQGRQSGRVNTQGSVMLSNASGRLNLFHLTSFQHPPLRTQNLGNEQLLGWGGGKQADNRSRACGWWVRIIPGEEKLAKAGMTEKGP